MYYMRCVPCQQEHDLNLFFPLRSFKKKEIVEKKGVACSNIFYLVCLFAGDFVVVVSFAPAGKYLTDEAKGGWRKQDLYAETRNACVCVCVRERTRKRSGKAHKARRKQKTKNARTEETNI